MVEHQAIRMHLPAGLLTGLGQCLDEVVPVDVVQENVVALVPTAHDVIHRSGILNSKLARHGGSMEEAGLMVKTKWWIFLRSDPIELFHVSPLFLG